MYLIPFGESCVLFSFGLSVIGHGLDRSAINTDFDLYVSLKIVVNKTAQIQAFTY